MNKAYSELSTEQLHELYETAAWRWVFGQEDDCPPCAKYRVISTNRNVAEKRFLKNADTRAAPSCGKIGTKK